MVYFVVHFKIVVIKMGSFKKHNLKIILVYLKPKYKQYKYKKANLGRYVNVIRFHHHRHLF